MVAVFDNHQLESFQRQQSAPLVMGKKFKSTNIVDENQYESWLKKNSLELLNWKDIIYNIIKSNTVAFNFIHKFPNYINESKIMSKLMNSTETLHSATATTLTYQHDDHQKHLNTGRTYYNCNRSEKNNNNIIKRITSSLIIVFMIIMFSSCVMGNPIKIAETQPNLSKIEDDAMRMIYSNQGNKNNGDEDSKIVFNAFSNGEIIDNHNDHEQPHIMNHPHNEQRIGLSNGMRFKILNQLRLNNNDVHRSVHHNYNHHFHNSQSRLSDPIFDPTIEEFSLDSRQTSMPIMVVKQLDDKMDENHHQSIKPFESNVENFPDDNIMVDKDRHLLMDDDEDEEEAVQKIIDSGWIQNSSTEKLLYYLRKIDKVLSNDASIVNKLSFEEQDDSFRPDKDEIINNKSNKSKNVDSLMENNKNFEIILNSMMNTPTVVKKRGEGPQLSIDYPLTVLRQRLVAELARRKAKKTEEQIAINTEILKKLGRRRRRRSIPIQHHQTISGQEQISNQKRYSNSNFIN